MTPKGAISKYSSVLKVSDIGPMVLRAPYLDSDESQPFTEFCKLPQVQDLLAPYSQKSTKDFFSSLAYTAFISDRASNAFARRIDFKSISRALVVSFTESFRGLIKDELKRKGLHSFTPIQRHIQIDKNYDASLNALVRPNVVLIQEVRPENNIHANHALSRLAGYAFRVIPKELQVSKPVKFNGLYRVPSYGWVHITNASGINISMIRYDDSKLALRFEFTIPYLLPVGSLSQVTAVKLLQAELQRMPLGLKV